MSKATNEKKNGVFLNWVSEQLVRPAVSKAGENLGFYNVSFDCQDSKSGYASVSVKPTQVYDTTKIVDEETKETEVVENFRNIYLGNPGTTRQVQIVGEDGKFTSVPMKVEEIVKHFKDGRAAYKAKQAAEKAAE